jgi:Calcineurin-like phosphoesterase
VRQGRDRKRSLPARARRLVLVAGRNRAVRFGTAALVGLGAVTATLALAPGIEHRVGPVNAHLALRPAASGNTWMDVPPLGRLSMDTHDGPLGLRTRVDGIRLDEARQLIDLSASSTKLERQAEQDVRHALIVLAVRTLLISLVTAALVSAVVFRRWAAVGVATASAAVALLASGGVAAATVRPQALSEPTFTGLLSEAPAIVGSAQDIERNFTAYRVKLTKLVENVSKLYGALSTLPIGLSSDDIRILWVSDIHNNPETFPVLKTLVDQFQVAAIVDTGDISDRGTAVENRLYAPIAGLGVPYVYVRGNHDSRTTQSYLASLPNVHVLDNGRTAVVAGLRWIGTGDPVFTPGLDVVTDTAHDTAPLIAAGTALAQKIEAQPEPVDVALVHEPPMAEPLLGTVPLVLDGHLHRRAHSDGNATLVLTQGSSGGAGFRNLEGDQPLPLEMSVLHFGASDHRLIAVDDITMGGLGLQSVTVQRHSADSYLSADESPTPGAGESPSP